MSAGYPPSDGTCTADTTACTADTIANAPYYMGVDTGLGTSTATVGVFCRGFAGYTCVGVREHVLSEFSRYVDKVLHDLVLRPPKNWRWFHRYVSWKAAPVSVHVPSLFAVQPAHRTQVRANPRLVAYAKHRRYVQRLRRDA